MHTYSVCGDQQLCFRLLFGKYDNYAKFCANIAIKTNSLQNLFITIVPIEFRLQFCDTPDLYADKIFSCPLGSERIFIKVATEPHLPFY